MARYMGATSLLAIQLDAAINPGNRWALRRAFTGATGSSHFDSGMQTITLPYQSKGFGDYGCLSVVVC